MAEDPDPLPVDMSTRATFAVRPGEIPITESGRVIVSPYFISTSPLGNSVVCTVTVRAESNPRTPHQVTVYWSGAAFTNTFPVPAVGSRSAKKGATRGGPVSR